MCTKRKAITEAVSKRKYYNSRKAKSIDARSASVGWKEKYYKEDVRQMAKRNIGLDAKEPKKICNNHKCPWHGHLKVRGRVFTGIVASSKASDTAIVEWNYYKFIQKYERYERRKTSVAAHNPACIAAKPGDEVVIAECRPLSKTKKFVVVDKL